jgi:hypothetical protein
MSGEIPKATAEDTQFAPEINHLHHDSLILLTAVMFCLSWMTGMRAVSWISPDLLHTWPVSITLAIGAILTYTLLSRYPHFAVWSLVISLILANTLAVTYFPHGLPPYLFTPIIVIAALFMSDRNALLVTALALAAMVIVALSPAFSVSWHDLQGPMLLTILTSFISWLGTRQLYTVLGWAWHSTQQAMKAAAEAQAHRAELARLNKELEGAYHRLERLNHMLILARQEAEEARHAQDAVRQRRQPRAAQPPQPDYRLQRDDGQFSRGLRPPTLAAPP